MSATITHTLKRSFIVCHEHLFHGSYGRYGGPQCQDRFSTTLRWYSFQLSASRIGPTACGTRAIDAVVRYYRRPDVREYAVALRAVTSIR